MLNRDINNGKYLAENITFQELKKIIYSKSHTGIVLLGTGGELNEWIQGVAGHFNKYGIIKSISPVMYFCMLINLLPQVGESI